MLNTVFFPFKCFFIENFVFKGSRFVSPGVCPKPPGNKLSALFVARKTTENVQVLNFWRMMKLPSVGGDESV
jgi:hypothetical protein